MITIDKVREILSRPQEPTGKELVKLLDYYEKEAEVIICRNCRGDIFEAIKNLKEMTNTTQYLLKKDRAIYKMRKGSKNTISNKVITDELAEAFLTINPERIKLFSKYNETFYEELTGSHIYKEEDKVTTNSEGLESDSDCSCEDKEAPCRDCLGGLKMGELRELYPEVKATSKASFIDQVIEDYESNK